MSFSGPRARAILVTALDLTILVLASAALVVVLGGRTRTHALGLTISIRSPWNLALGAAIAGLLRAAAGWRLPPLPAFARQIVLDDERLRMQRPMPWDRRAVVYALLALAGGAVWVVPQILHLRSVPDAGDPIFSAWRIAALAHQLATDPRRLWDGNIFFPLPHTITYSDSLFLQSLLGAPFLLAGADPLIVVNVLMAISYPARALGFFVAARRLTGDPQAALVAALAGAWAPFYPDHYSQLELQWTMFVPLAVLGLMRLLAEPRWRTGLFLGAATALQCLACMYVAVMLITFLVPFGIMLMVGWRVRPTRALITGAIGAALILGPVAGGLSAAYLKSREAHGDRSIQEVSEGSAFASEYGKAPYRMVNYRWQSRQGHRPERELFPGTSTVAVAAAAIVPPLTPVTIATMVAGASSFDLSLGVNGLVYDDLYRRFAAIRGMRVVSRFSVMVQTALAFLCAVGARRMLGLARTPSRRAALCATLATVILLDLRMDAALQPYPAGMPSIYRHVDASMVLAEMPDGHVVDSMYFSTRHWARLLSGYSGFFPPAPDLDRAKREFPSPDAIATLRTLGATHVTYTCAFDRDRRRCASVLAQLAANGALELVAQDEWQGHPIVLYRFTS